MGEEEHPFNTPTANYYRGVLKGLAGTKYEKSTVEFLKARDLIFPFPKDPIPSSLIQSQDFRRGCFESCGDFHFDKEGRPIVTCEKLDNLNYKDVNALDFLGLLYDSIDLSEELFDYSMYAAYKKLCQHQSRDVIETNIHFKKINPNAIRPFKEKSSDAGYEINIIRKMNSSGNNNTAACLNHNFDTGLIINPPFGYYFEVFNTDMLLEKGYSIINLPQILERSTTTAMSPTLKIRIGLKSGTVEALPLELPFPAIRLVPRHIEHFSLVEDHIHRVQ